MFTFSTSLVSLLIPAVVVFQAGGDNPRKPSGGTPASGGIEFKETVVAGGPDDFMEVRHIILRGSNFEIGRKLTEIAMQRHRTGPFPSPNRRVTRAQLRYFEKDYPTYVDRMRGVAAAAGGKLEVDAWNFSGLYYGFRLPGCSAVYYPPGTTAKGRGVLSRNFELSTGTSDGTQPRQGELPAAARPYVIEMHPNDGYSSLVTCLFDLLGGVMDGVNSEGLVIALLSDYEVTERYEIDQTLGPQAGFNETQIARYILDTCASVEEAKDALLGAKLYYAMAPNHYIIADRHGHAFIWENSHVMHRGYIIENAGAPLVTTNFMRHLHTNEGGLVEKEHPLGLFSRFKTIRNRLAGHEGPFPIEFIRETSRCVSFATDPLPAEGVATRTLWHALYFPEERRVEIDFYLGEKAGSAESEGAGIRRSGYKRFKLEMPSNTTGEHSSLIRDRSVP